MEHDWVKSTLGHGETMCRVCFITNREAAVLGERQCPGALVPVDPKPEEANGQPRDH